MRGSLSFYTLDVFTDRKFSGNPLAVVLDADSLSETEMLAIAREFNLSETVFVLEPRDPVNTARLRIFTPVRELPFAGHPTIGAAALIAELRGAELLARHDVAIALEEPIGLVRCEAMKSRAGGVYAQFALPQTPKKCVRRRLRPRSRAPCRSTRATSALSAISRRSTRPAWRCSSRLFAPGPPSMR